MPATIPPYPTLVARLVEEIVDSFEKLEIVVYLASHRRGTRSTDTIARTLSLSDQRTREATRALEAAGLLRTLEPVGSGWWLDLHSPWLPAIEALAHLYAESRPTVVDLVSRTSFATRRRAARAGRS